MEWTTEIVVVRFHVKFHESCYVGMVEGSIHPFHRLIPLSAVYSKSGWVHSDGRCVILSINLIWTN